MKEQIDKIKAALSSKDVLQHLTYYRVRDRTIAASDNRLVACTPFPYDGDFLVSGPHLEQLANRLGQGITLHVGPESITIISGKLKGTIKTLLMPEINYDLPNGRWVKPPATLLTGLQLVRPFIGDNAIHPWSTCACLGSEYIMGGNNVSLVRVQARGLGCTNQLLPGFAIDYVLDRIKEADLEAVMIADNAFAFMWSDDCWMKTVLVDSTFPEQALKMFDNLGPQTFSMYEDWKEGYNTIAEMSDSLVELYEDRISGFDGTSLVEYTLDHPFPVPQGGVSKWNPKFLTPAINIMERWCPELWPQPTTFTAPGIDGLIIGRN